MNRFFKFLRRIFRRRRKAAAPISIKFSAVGFEECSESLRAASDAMRSLGQAAANHAELHSEAENTSIFPSPSDTSWPEPLLKFKLDPTPNPADPLANSEWPKENPSISPSRQHAQAGEAFAERFRKSIESYLRKYARVYNALPMPRICAMLIAIEASPEDIHKLSTSKKIRLRKKIYHKTLRRIRIQVKRRNTHD